MSVNLALWDPMGPHLPPIGTWAGIKAGSYSVTLPHLTFCVRYLISLNLASGRDGVDVVVDMVGGEFLEPAVRSLI